MLIIGPPRSESTTVPTGSRRTIALRSARIASDAFMRESIGAADDPSAGDVLGRAEAELAIGGVVLA